MVYEREWAGSLVDHGFLNSVPILVVILVCQPIGPVMNYFSDYKSIHYWASNLPESYYGYSFLRIPFILLEYYLSAMATFAVGFYVLMCLIYVKGLTAASKLLL